MGTVPLLRSECCAPCDVRSYRVGCSFGGSESDGTCVLCPANTYKPARAFWEHKCTDCPAGTRAGLGVTFCSEGESCYPGFYRPKKGDQCRVCPEATYKSASGSPTEQCLDLIACTPDHYLTGFSKTSDGTCELCPLSTYKESGALFAHLAPQVLRLTAWATLNVIHVAVAPATSNLSNLFLLFAQTSMNAKV